MRGRQYFAKERCAQDRLEAALQTHEGVQLIVSHLVHQENVDRPRFLKDKYREAIMRFPESSELRYGRALHSAVLEKDELSAQKFVLEGKKLDHDDDGFLMMERIFAMATRVGGQTRTRGHLHRALLNIWCHPAREQMAIELLERVAGDLGDPAAAKLAERMLARFEKEIQAKSFHFRCGSQDAVAFVRKDFAGELLAWRRGHNYLFRVRYAVTTNEHQTWMVAELVVTTRETREVVSQLDRRDLLQAGCEDDLAHKLTEMLDVVRTADGVARIFLKFTQEPFPMMTALIPSTGSHLNVIAFPAKPDAEHVLDVILHASDLALGEDYRLEISNDEMKALFADEEGLLLARTRPGWRRKCKPLIAKLVSLLDLADLAVPSVGDLVVSIEPRYLRYMNASLQSQASTKRPKWYRLGRVVERSGLQFRMTPLREKKPQGSLLFEDLEDGKPTLKASSAKGAKAQDSTYWLGLEDVRLARVREGKLPSTLELVGPRVRINEPPDLARSFRLEKQRRKLILCGEARKTEAASNVAAIQVQRMPGVCTRQNAAASLRLLTQAMALDPTSVELNIGCSGLRRAMAHPIEIEKRSPLVPPPAESTAEADDDEEDEPLHDSKVAEREPCGL
ncbi:Hypothetical Protein FCC1311_048812 [Hondaea fermentalgiana]|uniref:Uncharacterized protein n=1 Tax=Hondaea fermentalgiana TaxID=2315210 RepID=A0A2R5GCF9_9STRA|nr:Hypothetical Protein FCC1311_048812 [Hondaea fermentalgiana]|eukprot:GBG28660.1 Hypothetical Protein FCC1311_048812 [Hondaea fermentalgiana]